MSSFIMERMNNLSVGKTHKKVIVIIGIGLFFELYEVFLAGVLSSVLQEQFHTTTKILPLLLGSSFLGMFFGSIFLGGMADRFGRKRVFIMNLTIYSVASLLVAVSPNVTLVILFRFISGFGLGSQPALCDTFLGEIVPAKKRGTYIAWAYTLAFLAVPIEGLLARWLVPFAPLGITGWRWMFVIGAIGAIVVFIVARNLPESPIWLVSRGRIREAEAVLRRFAGGLDLNDEKAVSANIHINKPNKASFFIIFKKPLLKGTVMIYILQIFDTIGYYGFGTLAPLVLASKGYTITHSLEYVTLSFIGYPLGSLLSIPIMERLDRKWLVVLSAFCMGVFGMLFGVADSSSIIIITGFIYTLVSNIFSNAAHTLQIEIFPTSVRATAAGASYGLSRLMSGLMPFILLPVLQYSGASLMFLIIAASMLIIMLDVALLAPSTTGKALDSLIDTNSLSRNKKKD